MKTFLDNLYIAWVIARKDIGDTLSHGDVFLCDVNAATLGQAN